MNFVRIGDKVISKKKIDDTIGEILRLRAEGFSQSDISRQLSIDRTFISRLETLGEVRKGSKIAVIGFPIENKKELEKSLAALGVDYILLLNEEERWQFVSDLSGLELFNTIMEIVARLHSYDHVIIIGSNKRIKIIQAVMDKEVIGIKIGESPIQENKWVDVSQVEELVNTIRE